MKEKNMKKGFKFEDSKPVGDKFKGAKIAKTFRIDLDVFAWLRSESDRTGIPYQTLLNSKLKECMQASQNPKSTQDVAILRRIERIEKELKIAV